MNTYKCTCMFMNNLQWYDILNISGTCTHNVNCIDGEWKVQGKSTALGSKIFKHV